MDTFIQEKPFYFKLINIDGGINYNIDLDTDEAEALYVSLHKYLLAQGHSERSLMDLINDYDVLGEETE